MTAPRRKFSTDRVIPFALAGLLALPIVALVSQTGFVGASSAEEAVKIHAGTLWCQFGVINAEGARVGEAGGLTVIMDRCLKVEHARYIGRMHWLGFNTQRITSVRGGLQ